MSTLYSSTVPNEIANELYWLLNPDELNSDRPSVYIVAEIAETKEEKSPIFRAPAVCYAKRMLKCLAAHLHTSALAATIA